MVSGGWQVPVQVEVPVCERCGHPATPPRGSSPIRRLLGMSPASAGCSMREVSDGRLVWMCTCRHTFHAR